MKEKEKMRKPPHIPKKNLMIASALINTTYDIPVRAANVVPKAMNIKSGEVLAVCEPVTNIFFHNEDLITTMKKRKQLRNYSYRVAWSSNRSSTESEDAQPIRAYYFWQNQMKPRNWYEKCWMKAL